MHLVVAEAFVRACERFIAKVTRVRAFAGVDTLVGADVIGASEFQLTVFATERFFSGVCAFVTFEFVLAVKAHCAFFVGSFFLEATHEFLFFKRFGFLSRF